MRTEDEMTTDVSLISGKLRTIGTGDTPETGTMILPRSETLAVTTVQAHSAGESCSDLTQYSVGVMRKMSYLEDHCLFHM